ncbi:MAG: sugar transferase [Phycisphaerae bacterium]|jgi:exopolysaccharide biosynthesis polyprenyl glycosylphosphotransferase
MSIAADSSVTGTPTAQAVAPSRPGSPTVARRRPQSRKRPVPGLWRTLGHAGPTLWAYFDFIFVALATYGAHSLLVFGHGGFTWVAGPLLSGMTFGGSFILAGLVFGLYENKTLAARSRIMVRTIMTLGFGLILAHACIFLLFYSATSRWLSLLVALPCCAVTIGARLFAHEAVTDVRRRVLCVGCGDSVRDAVALLGRTPRPHIEIAGHLRLDDQPVVSCSTQTRFIADSEREFRRSCPCLGTLDDLEPVLKEHDIDEVVVGAELSADPAVGRTVLTCLDRRCRVTDQPTFVEKLLSQVPIEDIDAQWFLVADVQSDSGYEMIKRLLDVVAATIGLVLSLPLWVLIAIAIRLDSAGPVFFRQRRVGRHGRIFTIYKFRTMRVDAEKDGARWADKNDPRVTRIGRFLRLSRMDELPQLWNILCGEMSIVGPRPERPEFVDHLSKAIPHYRQRHLLKPGLTGWAQIHFPYGATVEDTYRKLCFDLYYLKHRSIDMDFGIIIRTIGTFLLGAR